MGVGLLELRIQEEGFRDDILRAHDARIMDVYSAVFSL
jgi:hypothetical protein